MIELGTFENSPLRYPGSKARRAVRLLRLADQSKRHYVEPFAGGLGMLFRAKRENLFKIYHANDLNTNLINFYTVLRDYPDELIERLWTCYQYHGAGDEELFYQSQDDLSSGDDIKRAVAFFFLNKWSLRGDPRKGLIHWTNGRNGLAPKMLERLLTYSELLEEVKLTNLDYTHVDVSHDTFAYIDPPYPGLGKALYKDELDLTTFMDWSLNLTCSYMISLNDTAHIHKQFADFDRVVEPVKYSGLTNIGMRGGKPRITSELIIMNYKTSTRDAFVRQFGWSVRKARIPSKAG